MTIITLLLLALLMCSWLTGAWTNEIINRFFEGYKIERSLLVGVLLASIAVLFFGAAIIKEATP